MDLLKTSLSSTLASLSLGPLLEPLLQYLPKESVKKITEIPASASNGKRFIIINDWLEGLSQQDTQVLNNHVRILEMEIELSESIPTFFQKDFDHEKFQQEKTNFEKRLYPKLVFLKSKKNLEGQEKRLLSQLKRAEAMYLFYDNIFQTKNKEVLRPLSYQQRSDYKSSTGVTEKFAQKILNEKPKPMAHYYLDLDKYKENGVISENQLFYRIREDLSHQADLGHNYLSGEDNSSYPSLEVLRWKSRIEIEHSLPKKP